MTDRVTTDSVTVIDVSEKAPIAHSDDGMSCMASTVLKVCHEGHYVAAVALGNTEATAMVMAMAVVVGGLTPEQGMAVIRETEKALGLTYPLATWDDVLEVCRLFAQYLTSSGQAIIVRLTQDAQAKQQQTNLLN